MCKNSARIHKNVENAQRLTSHQQRERERGAHEQRGRARVEESARALNEHERARHFGRERGLRERRSSMQAKERERGRVGGQRKTAVRALRVRKALDCSSSRSRGQRQRLRQRQLTIVTHVQLKNGKLSSMREGVCERERERERERNSCVLINGNAM